MQEQNVYLLLGSNLGDSKSIIAKSIKKLGFLGEIIAISPYFETKAWGKTDLPNFINVCVCIKSNVKASDVLRFCLRIEDEAERIRSETWQSRTLDVDILAIDRQIWHTKKLILPHPLMSQRRFALTPFAAIAPNWVHPILHKSAKLLLANCNDFLEVTEICNEP